jgi:hypothetical protein
VDVNDAGEGTPGAAEADGVLRGDVDTGSGGDGDIFNAACDLAVEDDIAGGLAGIGAGLGGEIAAAVRVNLRVVKDGGGVSEDEVDAALDVGVDVVLAAVVGEERVLMAKACPVLPAVFSKVRLSASNPAPLISTVSVKKVPPACLALRLLVMTTSEGDLPMPTRVMLVWFWVTMTRS